MLGSVILIIAPHIAGLSTHLLVIALPLTLLGLVWNLFYGGESTHLTHQLSVAEQSRMQGMNDLFVWLVSGTGSLASGFVFTAVGYQAMGLIGAALAMLPLALSMWWVRKTIQDSTT
jgi:predicted MFS family arabinose efflux permease